MDLISNEFVFAKRPSDKPRGKMNTRELWANHRRTIRHQAELDFMQEVLEEVG